MKKTVVVVKPPYLRILKVARTVADLAGEKNVESEHLAEAIPFRSLDRGG